jgi:hypothetical protein
MGLGRGLKIRLGLLTLASSSPSVGSSAYVSRCVRKAGSHARIMSETSIICSGDG